MADQPAQPTPTPSAGETPRAFHTTPIAIAAVIVALLFAPGSCDCNCTAAQDCADWAEQPEIDAAERAARRAQCAAEAAD